MASSAAGWSANSPVRNWRAALICFGEAGKARDQPISGAVVASRMPLLFHSRMPAQSISSSHPHPAVLGSPAKTGCRQGVSERNDQRVDRPGSGAEMPLVRELDPSAGPFQFFGAELRRARTAAGFSQDQLGGRLGYSGAQVGKVEMGERAPAQDFAEACDRAFPDAGAYSDGSISWPAAGTAATPRGSSIGWIVSVERHRCVRGNPCWCLACCRPPTTHGRSSPPIRRRPRRNSANSYPPG